MDTQAAMESAKLLGFQWPSPSYLAGAILFGLVGLVAYRLGRRQERPRTAVMGVVLMLYPYLVSATWLLWLIGAGLCLGIWLDRQG